MKRFNTYTSVVAMILVLVSMVLSAEKVSAASFTCTNLTRDLVSGSTDAKTGGEVTKLQSFLKAGGYLSATPNGNFGPATIAAVKSFQSANSISATGTIGPLTRIAVQVRSCSATTSTSASSSSSGSTPTTTTTTTTSSTQNVPSGITAPVLGERLTIGQKFTISWRRDAYGQDIILEDETGLPQGFITSSIGGTNVYPWKVGYVYSTKTQMDMPILPGSYRIRVRGPGADQVSGFFTIDAPALTVKSLVPSELPADGSSAGVIYGSGFTEATSVLFDGRVRSAVSRLYTSTDGKVIVFAVPTSITPGSHSIILSNDYGTSPVYAGVITITSSGNTQ